MTISRPSRVRPPLQERTREGWERILSVGLDLLRDGGWDALTITAVCREARVSAPTIYARVDGRSGLFEAVYEHGMELMWQSEAAQFADVVWGSRSATDRIGRVVLAICQIFTEHERLLRPVIQRVSVDAGLRDRGARESRRVVELISEALPGENANSKAEIARMLFAECVFRVMYGDSFLDDQPEEFDSFVARLTRMSLARFHT